MSKYTHYDLSQIKMFGETVKEFNEAFNSGGDTDKLMYAMSILSDAQEVMAMGQTEVARQFINKSKYFISKVMAEKREAEIKAVA